MPPATPAPFARIIAAQQAMHPAALRRARPAPQQDALAIHTQTECSIHQTRLGQWACDVAADFAWVSVADGVATSPCADLASRSFLEVLHGAQLPAAPANQLPSLVRRARVDWQSRYLRSHTLGAACTLASLWCADGRVCAVNCGDSRIWRLRPQADGSVQWLQISRDHTVWQQMLQEGEVLPEEAGEYAAFYQGLMHCLILGDDAPEDDWLHVWHGQALPGDCYLLATDGLHDTLPAARLQALWQAHQPPQANLDALHAAYRQAGAPDDVSVVALCLGA